jgi:hypothetical protein
MGCRLPPALSANFFDEGPGVTVAVKVAQSVRHPLSVIVLGSSLTERNNDQISDIVTGWVQDVTRVCSIVIIGTR